MDARRNAKLCTLPCAEGLVLPLDAGYHLAAEANTQSGTDTLHSQMFDMNYRFLHDRVQQAAYALIPGSQRQQAHLQIGRHLQAQSRGTASEELLLEIVDHLNIGAPGITARSERIELARQNLTAGQRAKAAAAYQAATAYFAAGTAMLDEACFDDEYTLSFALHTALAECQYLNGQFKESESRFERILARAQSKLDRAHVYQLLIVLYTMRSEIASALRVGRAGLALFGVQLSETDDELRAAFEAQLSAMKASLRERPIADLVNAPRLTDEERLAHLELLVKLRPASFFAGPVISSVVIAMPVNLCLQYGHSELCEPVYSGIGYTLISLRGMYEQAREFFHLSAALAERSSATRLRCVSDVLLGGHAHFFLHFRKAQPILERGRRTGLQTGDLALESLVTRSTLQSGIAYAMEQLGGKWGAPKIG